jgi:threonylcarbamoyladenosine tRNA methylthiotransferase MtaB
MAGFHIENFGCRAARADGEAIAGHLRAFADREPFASDVVVVNTCSVTAEADRAARAFIRRAHRKNPAAKIIVTGCYAQRAPQELANMAGVAAVVGNSHKALAPEIVFNLAHSPANNLAHRLAPSLTHGAPIASPPSIVPVASLLFASTSHAAPIWADDRFAHSFIEDAQLTPGAQTRPNLKIQEGCGNRCTFCVIPQTRGPSRSMPAASVIRQVETFVAAGGNELVISGINLGRWGHDFSHGRAREPLPDSRRMSLADLIRFILRQTTLPRLRLSSIEPMDWDRDLIALFAEFGAGEFGDCRLAHHAHLPLQSGSDAVLRRMHRRYRPWHYAEKVSALFRAAGSDLTLGADVMAGFPGETDREFEETLAFIGALPFGYLHLFPFSARPGTAGWALHSASPVPPAVLEERMTALRALAAEKTLAHRRRFIGRELSAVTLNTPALGTASPLAAGGYTAALSENFLPISLSGRFASNQLLQVRLAGIHSDGSLIGVSSH